MCRKSVSSIGRDASTPWISAPSAGESGTTSMTYSSDVRFLRRSPFQTFILVPLAVLLWELALGVVHVQLLGLLVMAWGFAQYRLVGRYRVRLGGGGPGLSGAPPERLVESGIYRYTRNPMYMGHIVYMIGVAVLFQSWFG